MFTSINIKRLARICSIIFRFKKFDLTSQEGRSLERYRLAAQTTMASGLAKGISMLSLLISVPLTLHYLGGERYGMWMTLSSLVAMLGFADLGLGLGLVNTLSAAHGRDDRNTTMSLVSSGFFMLLGAAAFILVVLGCSYPFIDWQQIYKVKSTLAIQEAGPATVAFIACFALNMPLGVVQNIQSGYQEGFKNSLWESLGRLIALGCLLLTIHFNAGLPWLVLSLSLAPLLALLLNNLLVFGWQRPWLRPHWERSSLKVMINLLKLSVSMLLLKVAWVMTYSVDNFIITQIMGPEEVTQYAVPARMFSTAQVLINMILIPLWPAYGEALARGDNKWVTKTLKRSLFFIISIVGFIAFVLTIFGKRLIYLWVGGNINPSLILLSGFGIYSIQLSLGSAIGIMLMADNIIYFQIICNLATLFSSIVLKILLGKLFGLSGIIWSTVISLSLFLLLPYLYYIQKYILVKKPILTNSIT